MTAISERQRARFYICKKQKKIETFLYTQKAGHFAKSKTISVRFLNPKSMTLYVTRFFMTFLKLAFMYKKHDTLLYVTFLYTKSRTLRKNANFKCHKNRVT